MASQADFFEPAGRPVGGVLLALTGSIVLISFVIPAGNAAWRQLDEAVFLALNGTLAGGGTWATFWAWANYRPMDLVSALMMLAFLVLPGPVFRPDEVRRALFGFFAQDVVALGNQVQITLGGRADLWKNSGGYLRQFDVPSQPWSAIEVV